MDNLYINKVLKGDTEAFSYFVRSYQDQAYAIAISIVKQQADARDVVQEGFIQAFTSLGSFRQEGKFSSWLFKIVVNKALQFLARRKRTTALAETASELPQADVSACNDAMNNLKDAELKALVRDTLAKLSPKEALVLQLFYLNDYKIREIEEVTGFSKANVKVLLHRGRNNFYSLVQDRKNKAEFKDLIC